MTARLLRGPAIGAICRLLLGGLFIYAAVPKLLDPYAFARLIYGYRILHRDLVNLAALLLPWIELLPAALLVLGICVRSAGVVLGGVLVAFLGAMGLAMARGLHIECGCFLPLFGDKVGWSTLLRDAVLLLLALQVIVWPSRWGRTPEASV